MKEWQRASREPERDKQGRKRGGENRKDHKTEWKDSGNRNKWKAARDKKPGGERLKLKNKTAVIKLQRNQAWRSARSRLIHFGASFLACGQKPFHFLLMQTHDFIRTYLNDPGAKKSWNDHDLFAIKTLGKCHSY